MDNKSIETYILSLGGSIIAPDMVDVEFLKQFKAFILEKIKEGKRFVIITGGGKPCRRYQAALKEISPKVSKTAVDWVGIRTTQLNCELIYRLFEEKSFLIPNFNPSAKFETDKSIIVGAGYEPGHSTDNDAVLIAQNLGAKHIVNLSNINYVYDKDPKKFKDAKRLENITWDDLIKILPKSWDPGLNSPFDPIAARKAKKLDIEVATMNGRHLDQLENYLNDKPFKGTLIKN